MSGQTDDNHSVLFRTATDPDLTTDEKLRALLNRCRERLDTENAHLVRIDPDESAHKVLQTVGSELVEQNAETPLSETFCRRTIDTEGLFVINDATEEGFEDDPAYQRWDIGCYIGGRIELADGAYLTVCFVDKQPRSDLFSSAQQAYADQTVRWIRLLLEREESTDSSRVSEAQLERSSVGGDAIVMLDADGQVAGWNDLATELTGFRPDDIQGMSFSDFHTEQDQDTGLPGQLLADARNEGAIEHEGWRVTSDGTRCWLFVTITAIYSGNGGFDGYGVVMRDFSESRTAEQIRNAQQAITQGVIDAFEDLFVVLDADGSIQWINQRGLELSGVSRERITTVDVMQFIVPEDRKTVRESIETAITEGESTAVVTIVTPDNERFEYEFRAVPLTDAEGTVEGVAAIGRDITERNLHEQRLDVTSRVLRHNLRNDITAIKGWATEIADGSAENPEAAALRIIETADELIDLSEKARRMAEIGPIGDGMESVIDVTDCVRESADAFRPAATIDIDIRTEQSMTVGNRELLRLALRNAIENAIEHSEDAEPWVGVTVSAGESSIRIEIEDRCQPVPEHEAEVLDRGIESPLEHSSGLGLWLLQWAVATLGGTVSIERQDEIGNCVTIVLPQGDWSSQTK